MKIITVKFGILLKNGVHSLFENGTVTIFNDECEVFSFETEQERDEYLSDNEMEVAPNHPYNLFE